jgi:hypothetical protein
MAERLPDPAPPRTTSEPVESTPEIARRNIMLGIGLLVIALLIAGGTVAVSLLYLHYD